MGKTHELLAVEGDLKKKADQTTDSVAAQFKAGEALFTGQTRTYEPRVDGEIVYPPENKPLAARVPQLLAQVRKDYGRWMDVLASKEVSNADPAAKAAVVVDGQEILPPLPALALINLESRLAELLKLYQAIPTTDILRSWDWDAGNNFWKTPPAYGTKSKKKHERFEKAPATKEHPAQVDIIQIDVVEGTWTTTLHSGALSPVQKAERLERIEALLMAVRKARQRANDNQAADAHVAEKIFAFIEGG